MAAAGGQHTLWMSEESLRGSMGLRAARLWPLSPAPVLTRRPSFSNWSMDSWRTSPRKLPAQQPLLDAPFHDWPVEAHMQVLASTCMQAA